MNNKQRTRWEAFWLRPISAAGFGLMRVGFGLTALLTQLMEWPMVDRLYGPDGILHRDEIQHVLRHAWRFSLIDHVGAQATHGLYAVLLVSLAFVALGLFTRWALLISVVLLYSFHEYGVIALNGGDTLLRLIGFILLISPCDRSFTLTNLFRRMRVSQNTGKDQPVAERTMAIWPYRLLLWQMIILYAASSVEKWSGATWKDGSAVSIVLHHSNFSRLPTAAADLLSFASPLLGYFTLVSQSAWILLLPIGLLTACRALPDRAFDAFKRALLLCGVFIHLGILLILDVGTFSLTVFVAYLGLLTDNDFRAIRARLNRNFPEKGAGLRPAEPGIVVLFDGRCGFCSRTIIILKSLDWLNRLTFRNFHDPSVRKTFAPKLDIKTLNEEMHVRLPDGSYRKGFFAFRTMCRHLPALWLLWPLLYVPGIPFIGKLVYGFVARHR